MKENFFDSLFGTMLSFEVQNVLNFFEIPMNPMLFGLENVAWIFSESNVVLGQFGPFSAKTEAEVHDWIMAGRDLLELQKKYKYPLLIHVKRTNLFHRILRSLRDCSNLDQFVQYNHSIIKQHDFRDIIQTYPQGYGNLFNERLLIFLAVQLKLIKRQKIGSGKVLLIFKTNENYLAHLLLELNKSQVSSLSQDQKISDFLCEVNLSIQNGRNGFFESSFFENFVFWQILDLDCLKGHNLENFEGLFYKDILSGRHFLSNLNSKLKLELYQQASATFIKEGLEW